jgi:hypothetical protein
MPVAPAMNHLAQMARQGTARETKAYLAATAPFFELWIVRLLAASASNAGK